jgi:hypothetical protein
MKYIITSAVIAFFAISATSCHKTNYYCKCVNVADSIDTVTLHIGKVKSGQATETCSAYKPDSPKVFKCAVVE